VRWAGITRVGLDAFIVPVETLAATLGANRGWVSSEVNRLIELGYILRLHKGHPGNGGVPASYRWDERSPAG
jgi:hypothetical protein